VALKTAGGSQQPVRAANLAEAGEALAFAGIYRLGKPYSLHRVRHHIGDSPVKPRLSTIPKRDKPLPPRPTTATARRRPMELMQTVLAAGGVLTSCAVERKWPAFCHGNVGSPLCWRVMHRVGERFTLMGFALGTALVPRSY